MMQRNEAQNLIAADGNPAKLDAAHRLRDDAHEEQKEPTTAHQRKVRGPSYALSSLRAGLSDDENYDSIPSHNGYVLDHDKDMGNSADDGEIITFSHHDEQMRGSSRSLPLRVKYNYPTTDHHHHHHADHYKHDRHVEHNAHNDPLSQLHEVASAEHHGKRGGRIAASTLQAARAQAAELRALHSAVLNSSLGIHGTQHGMVHSQRPMPFDDPMVQSKGRVNKKKSKIYHNIGGGKEKREDVQGTLSSASSASSTADCFIRPLHEYPVFMPHSHVDPDILMATTSSMDDVPSLHRRSSVDTYEAAMRDERLHYIFDHDNKRSFSKMHSDDHSVRMSSLHESLNLPPRSTAALLHLHNNGDHPLHHMSLNLPQGSQHHLFKSSMQNPLFDSNSMHINKRSSHHLDDRPAYSPLLKRLGDNVEATTTPKKNNQTDKYADAHEAALPDFTSRQRALIEFLSEEPARMRAFNELAAKEAAQTYSVHPSTAGKTMPKQKTVQEDNLLASSVKHTGTFEYSARHLEQVRLHGGVSGHHHHHHPHHERPAATGSIPQMRQRLNHGLKNAHIHQTGSVSCDKCRPAGGFPTVVVPLPDSREISAIKSAENAVIKERPDQLKKPSIKDWFFRGRKKQNNVDHSTHPATPPSSRDRTPVTSGTFSASKLEQLSKTPTTPPTSHVLPGLATSEVEKELEVAMAMDLMELKVLQANTKRDAALAEVLELRLAMDSMAKKLAEVERHCESLKSQLVDVQALREMQIGPNKNSANSGSGTMYAEEDEDEIAAADRGYTGETGVVTDGEDDFCESDSHDNRKERNAAASEIRPELQISGYGGGRSRRNSRDMTQPKKEEFLSAVAEARVGVKQVSRVLLQYVQESMGRGMLLEIGEEEAGAAEQWRPILILCREARRAEKGGSSSRSREVGYCIEALISLAFYEHFENVGFDKSGAHQILDPAQRALAFYHSFLKLAKLTPTQLLTQSSGLYNPTFDRFCSRKMRALGRAVGCPGRLWPDELARTFLSAARAVWLLHHLAFAYPACPPGIFRVAARSPFDARFMELLPADRGHAFPSTHLVVSLLVIPGFFLSDDVIKCKVLA